jgi:gamma-glutamyltranspeptidase/glutathione hydrolase
LALPQNVIMIMRDHIDLNASNMTRLFTRRQMLRLTGEAALAGAMAPAILRSSANDSTANPFGVVAGEPAAAKVGAQILAEGGNAVDAAVASALAAAVVSPNNCGIGGYGGHMVVALANGQKVTAIDFNSMAPASAQPGMFALDEKGGVRGRLNEFGWLASGVPGTLAGLELATQRYGTKSIRELLAPAIGFARLGFPAGAGLAGASRNMAARLRTDPGSVKLLLNAGEPYKAGETFRNQDLAKLLAALAKDNSVESFYRGSIAQQIADAFGRNGGLVTANDLAGYRAREIEPLRLDWKGFSIFTAPLTAGGLTVFQALSILKALKWDGLPPNTARAHRRVEALRVAWRDRLEFLGDPDKSRVPVQGLLSEASSHKIAQEIETAVKEKKPLSFKTESRPHGGTVHLSAVDRQGNMAAVTLTHGNAFGACVTVDGLGLTLGHGMSRFDPRPSHPNSVGAGKKPLHNMCPTVVLRDGRPVLALGGAGGRRIVNGVFDALSHYVALGASMEEAIAAPRLHTEGNLDLHVERQWSDSEYLKSIGYKVINSPMAKISAVSFDPKTQECRAASR